MCTCADNFTPHLASVHVSIMLLFSVESMVRGYQVYKEFWDAVVGQEFPCKHAHRYSTLRSIEYVWREDGNRVDPFTVAVVSTILS